MSENEFEYEHFFKKVMVLVALMVFVCVSVYVWRVVGW